MFVHLLNQDGQQVAGADGPPAAGDYPTPMWRIGDQVDDQHIITLPGDLAPGSYQIAVGLYDPTTGARVARLDGAGDSVSLPVTVRAP